MIDVYNYSKKFLLVVVTLLLFACNSDKSSSGDNDPATPPDMLFMPDSSPDDFTVEAEKNVLLNTMVISNSVTIMGINVNVNANISVDNGEYSVDGGPYRSNKGFIANGQVVTLRLMSPSEYASEVSLTLSVGDKSSVFTVATASSYITELRKYSGTELVPGNKALKSASVLSRTCQMVGEAFGLTHER